MMKGKLNSRKSGLLVVGLFMAVVLTAGVATVAGQGSILFGILCSQLVCFYVLSSKLGRFRICCSSLVLFRLRQDLLREHGLPLQNDPWSERQPANMPVLGLQLVRCQCLRHRKVRCQRRYQRLLQSIRQLLSILLRLSLLQWVFVSWNDSWRVNRCMHEPRRRCV